MEERVEERGKVEERERETQGGGKDTDTHTEAVTRWGYLSLRQEGDTRDARLSGR